MNINRGFVSNIETLHPAGFDKIALHSKDFEVLDTINFTINPNQKKQGQPQAIPTPLFMCKGEQIDGTNAYHNAGEEMGNLKIDINFKGLSVSWNPSKLLGKYSGELASLTDVEEGAKIIQDYLSEIGLSTNISNHKFTRLDLSKDRCMDEKVFVYQPALGWLNGSRMKERVQYPDGIRIGNQTKQICFYDKGFERHKKLGRTNLMRGEIKMMDADQVQRVMNLSHVHQLKDIHQTDISNIYSSFITNDVFKSVTHQYSIPFKNEVNLLRSLNEKKYGAFQKWLMLHGVEKISSLYSTEILMLMLTEAGFSRASRYRATKELSNMIHINSLRNQDEKTTANMFEEIRQKFVA